MNIGNYGGYTIVRKLEELSVKDFSVAVASAITSYSRMKLYKLLKTIKDAGERVLYLDTDSVITTMKLCDHKDVIKKFDWDKENDCRSNGDNLGTLKNEADDDVQKYFKKKYPKDWHTHFMKQKKLDSGEFHFDCFIGAGCKQYGLQKTLYDGGVIETCKLKGYKSKGKEGTPLKFKNMDDLMTGFYKEIQIREENKDLNPKQLKQLIKEELKDLLIVQNQIQFLCPLSSHISENEKMEVTKNTIEKWFRVGYSKGKILDNGSVIPLVWKNGQFN